MPITRLIISTLMIVSLSTVTLLFLFLSLIFQWPCVLTRSATSIGSLISSVSPGEKVATDSTIYTAVTTRTPGERVTFRTRSLYALRKIVGFVPSTIKSYYRSPKNATHQSKTETQKNRRGYLVSIKQKFGRLEDLCKTVSNTKIPVLNEPVKQFVGKNFPKFFTAVVSKLLSSPHGGPVGAVLVVSESLYEFAGSIYRSYFAKASLPGKNESAMIDQAYQDIVKSVAKKHNKQTTPFVERPFSDETLMSYQVAARSVEVSDSVRLAPKQEVAESSFRVPIWFIITMSVSGGTIIISLFGILWIHLRRRSQSPPMPLLEEDLEI